MDQTNHDAMPERHDGAPERRVDGALRALVNDMMTQIRSAVAHGEWTAEERARAEADLARIMDQVRQEALARGGR